jgi:uncharacterized protein with von Willebrand factor type A (vWA) domain
MNITKEEYIKIKEAAEQKAIGYYIRNKEMEQINIHSVKMDDYFAFDNLITSATTTYATEIKVRKDYSYAQIKNYGGQLLEQLKLNRIIEQLNESELGYDILYFIFFSDRLTIYKLDKEVNNYLWQPKLLPKNNYDSTLVWKEVAMLHENNIIETIKY